MKMISKTLIVSLLSLFLFSQAAFAQTDEAWEDVESGKQSSPRNWTAHAEFGVYKLSYIDDEFSNNTDPYTSVFGNKYKFHVQAGAERLLWQGVGTVGLEAAIGYWQTTGKGLYRDGTKSADSTTFRMIPLKLSAVYRYTDPWDKWDIPLVPFVKFGLDYYIWWISKEGSGTSEFEAADGTKKSGYGGTFGLHVSYGLQLCLDFMDKRLANEFDQDMGVNNTYLYFEGTFAYVNDFGSSSSFNLSSHYFMGGILFEL